MNKNVYEFFRREEEYPDLDVSGAAARLSSAIKCRTINYSDKTKTDFGEFDKLHELMKKSFPNLMKAASFEEIGHSVLITLKGTDPSLRPCLYMAHQDVVPVVKGTESQWKHGAFDGDIEDGIIWGRGTLDVKDQMFGEMEAAEYLLAHGKTFRRTAYFAYGEDEETLNTGARAVAEELKRRGVTLEFVLDEGGGKIEPGTQYGAEDVYITSIVLMEKGYADLKVTVHGNGGHSARPFGGTSLGHLSCAVADIVRSPFPVKLPTPLIGAYEALAPYIKEEPLRSYVQDVRGNADKIAAWCSERKSMFPFVMTTVAPTMIEGGSSAPNVLPADMYAVLNIRANQGETASSVLEHCRNAVTEKNVEFEYLQEGEASQVARSDGYGYAALKEALEYYYKDVVVIPSLMVAGADAHNYEIVCDTCLRCVPFMTEPEDFLTGVHGVNEHLSVRAYAQGIRLLIHLMEKANL